MVEIELKGADSQLLLDPDDALKLAGKKLYYNKKTGQVFFIGPSKNTVAIWRYLLNAPSNLDVDHINHNRLDNRRANLRSCTRSQNHWNTKRHRVNTSNFKGVSWNSHAAKFEARIRLFGEKKVIGYFINPLNAAIAYQMTARTYFKEYAYLG